MKPRLYTKYLEEVAPALKTSRGYTNPHQIPRIEKIVVNMGVRCDSEKGSIEEAVKEMALITGQKPVVTKAKKSVANFKLRQGQSVGCKVTLRRAHMYEFLDRLVTSALPRIRDFRGISPRKFDGRGAYSIGLPDQTIFPEIELDKIKRQQGMDVTIVTTASKDEEALELLRLLGMPFSK
jgi:large subunit ribosomal protein L5